MIIKKIGTSPLTGTIFQGRLNTKTSMWVGEKTDVTDDCVAAVAEHLRHIKKDYCFPTTDGKFLVLSTEVHDTLPDRFK